MTGIYSYSQKKGRFTDVLETLTFLIKTVKKPHNLFGSCLAENDIFRDFQ
jgi:hypothetical protein